MKKYFLGIAFLTLLVAGCGGVIVIAFGQNNDLERAEDEKAIRANFEQMIKGWNMKSGEEFAKPFAEDADYVVVNGMHIKGRAANARGHQQIFDTIYKDTDLAGSIEQIRFLRPDVAVVHVLAERFPKAEKNPAIRCRLTLVMVKNGGKWEIEAFQNTQIQSPDGRDSR